MRWIVDYKTSRPASDSAADLRAKAEAYRLQLERYAGLFATEGLPIKLAVYFVGNDCLVELPYISHQK